MVGVAAADGESMTDLLAIGTLPMMEEGKLDGIWVATPILVTFCVVVLTMGGFSSFTPTMIDCKFICRFVNDLLNFVIVN